MAHSLKVSCLAYEQSCLSFTILWPFLLLPAAAKLWPRLCFYTCLWFCSRGGGWSPENPPLWPGRHPPQDQADTPPGRENPPSRENTHTPPDQADAPPPTPAGRTPPPPGTRQIPPLQENPPPGKKTAAYGHWAAGTHPTGMHSCSQCRSFILLPFVIHNCLKKWWIP